MAIPIKLQNGEQIVREYRRHPVFLIRQLLIIAAGWIFPILIVNRIVNALGGLLGQLAEPLASIWTLGALIVASAAWFSYQHDEWFVTNQRLVDVARRSVFSTAVSTADLISVQDISADQTGILAQIFGYGDVACQTAGSQSNFVIRGVANPQEAIGLVDDLRDKARLELKRA